MNEQSGKPCLVVDESYSRADASLWDDSDLVRLWNEQLKVINRKGEPHGLSLPREPSHSHESPTDMDEGAESTSITASSFRESPEGSTSSIPNALSATSDSALRNLSTRKRARHEPHEGLSLQTALPIAHLPRAVRQLVVSFYTAGYEAGKYAAQTEGHQGKRKRDHH
ncbi:unnamed protein product [Phytomonas sp. Hart1]|nr:unnamed protein product [Phytomonas sp. Hart1]|eukprot:CCW70664.1 unnamed protein product [Phytomonas sp. isolate Hart1]